jgi:2-(1,2-epoxy-1,2-dihydrophenyl)acetyl-CoA isomerase
MIRAVTVGREAEVSVEREGDIATITLNRPARLNAFDLTLTQLLLDRVREIAKDSRCSAVVIAGTGPAFSAGADLVWASEAADGLVAALFALVSCFHQLVLEICQMAKPVVAAINGVAAGEGFALALASDFRVLDRSATLRQAYTSAGLSIDGGCTFTLPRLVGVARALEIAALDEVIDAERALSLGLVTRVVDPGASVLEARALARELTARSACSFAWSKQLFQRAHETTLRAQLKKEREGIVACASDPEGEHGVRAFVSSRQPEFRLARSNVAEWHSPNGDVL